MISQRIPAEHLHKLYGHSDRLCIGFEHEVGGVWMCLCGCLHWGVSV